MEKLKLKPEQLTSPCDSSCFGYDSTAELTPLYGVIGQERATKALDFGLSINQNGYNIYVSGSWGSGRNSYVRRITEKKAAKKPAPCDWVYVHNFKDPHAPLALDIDNGGAKDFDKGLERVMNFLKKEIETVFSGKEYENTKTQLMEEYQENTQKIIGQLNEIGEKFGFRFSQNERGLISIPLKNGEPMTEEEYRAITEEEYEEMKLNSGKLSNETVDIFGTLRNEEEAYRQKIKELDELMGRRIVTLHLLPLREKFEARKAVVDWLDQLVEDIVENIDRFRYGKAAEASDNPMAMLQAKTAEAFFDRYKVNIFVDNSEKTCAPIVFENNPTYINLMGAVEYKNEMGVMKTDFTMIKKGSMHEANGGFLVVHAKDILTASYAWMGLKRCMLTKEINIEALGKQMGLMVATTLRPQPIPLDVKVIIIGDAYTYYLLYQYDEDFRKLFKITAEFDMEMPRNEDNIKLLARFIAAHCEKDNLRHFDRNAVAKIIEYASRMSDDQTKLSSRLNRIVDILYEANSWAEVQGDTMVRRHHVETALEEKRHRSDMSEEKTMEMFDDGTYLLDVEGEKVGEINGLAVVGTGQYSFGKPSKITVSTYRGQSGIINIEREARTSGKIHDKGVLIISGYMGHTYAQDKPLALACSIVFEQLYSGVDGDSASSTELYAILSSLSGVPISQSIAVTGSVNQRGQIQPIGGVNEKIEGFFKVCRLKGLNGSQGVVIPKQNVKNLMLSNDVIEAVKAGMFHIYAVGHIDEGIEILMGKKAGERQKNGEFPKGTVHYLVNQRLKELAKPLYQRNTDKKQDKKGKAEGPAKKPVKAKPDEE